MLEDGAIPNEIVDMVRGRLSGCVDTGQNLDVVWEWKRNLISKPYSGYPFKFLTIYREDFVENHIVLCGGEPPVPDMPLSRAVHLRIDHLEKALKRRKNDPRALSLLAGEIARHIAYLNGSSLHKGNVYGTLLRIGDMDGARIYRAYLQGGAVKDMDFLIRYVEKGIERLREIASGL